MSAAFSCTRAFKTKAISVFNRLELRICSLLFKSLKGTLLKISGYDDQQLTSHSRAVLTLARSESPPLVRGHSWSPERLSFLQHGHCQAAARRDGQDHRRSSNLHKQTSICIFLQGETRRVLPQPSKMSCYGPLVSLDTHNSRSTSRVI